METSDSNNLTNSNNLDNQTTTNQTTNHSTNPNHNSNQFDNLCLGIDFGTTNSCISVWYKNKSILIPDFDGSDTIPTVIEINTDKKIIGKEAYIRKDIFDKTNTESNQKNVFLVYEIKKLLGKKYSELTKEQINMIAYDIRADSEDNIIIIDSSSGKIYYPEEIAIHIFMSFKLRAETFLANKFGQSINIFNSVISVPAYFNKIQRQIIKNSAENAGLNVIRLINEPTAASICYGLGKNLTSNTMNIVVFDFGGGTLDVSLLSIGDGIYEVLASCGNNNLGGSDFDKKIMEHVINEFIKLNDIDYEVFIELVEENSLQKLKYLCEQAKIALSDNSNTKIKIDNFYQEKNLNVGIDREQFNILTQDLMRLIIKPINDVLDNAEMSKEDINEIIMVGGMTRVPQVRYNVERFFNKDVNCSIDPDTVVSIGASIHGYMLTTKDIIQDKLLLIDRTPLSIGVETSGGIMDTLIPRGSIIPIKKNKKYTTDTDYVDSIDIKIYEGERKFTKDNFLIGNFTLTGIEKQKRGIPEIQITFEIDTDGIIKIKAEDLDNPLNKKSIQVSGNKQNLSKEQIEEIIASAKQMDQIDRIDKMKKESYLSLIESSKKIIENIGSSQLQIPPETKESIIQNVNEILEWLKSNTYDSIDVDKYKELLHDYKINYSIYLIQQNTPVINLESAQDEEQKGIEIYEDDNNSKKYIEQIKYFRQIIDEYDDIKKQINIASSIDNKTEESNNQSYEYQQKIILLKNELANLLEYANDYLLKFFVDKNLTDEIVQEYIHKLYQLDLHFKNNYNDFNDKFNYINKFIHKLKCVEEFYINKLENISYQNNKQNNQNDEQNNQTELINQFVNEYEGKLEIILEFQTIVYKMTSEYIKVDNQKINDMLKIIDNLVQLDNINILEDTDNNVNNIDNIDINIVDAI
jgi:molecular chaperone DnaK (HSP70)